MLALHRALEAGYRVEALLAMFDEDGVRSRSHGLPPALMQAQAEALGIALVMRQASWRDYEAVFTDQLKAFAAQGITHALFGDIDLQAHRDWEERVCAAAGLEAVLPLWQQDRLRLAQELLRLGYRARVVCVDARWLDASYCGREYDQAFIDSLPPDVDACGENGEFHSFAFDGPRFGHAVAHRLAAIHELRMSAPAPGHYFVAELQ
jgi:uncharacterized protein (TIGR00290 family)